MEINNPPDQMTLAMRAASAEIALTIDPAYEAGVQEHLNRLKAVAEFLMQFPLPQNVEPAPVFQP